MIETELKMILKTFTDLYYFKTRYNISVGSKLIINLINLALHISQIYKSHEVLEVRIYDGIQKITKSIYGTFDVSWESSYTEIDITIEEIESFIILLNENDIQKFIDFLELKFTI